MFTIELTDKTTFQCEPHESIIDAALRNGVYLEYSCRSGRCSSCKYQVLNGETQTESDELSLTDQEKQVDYILTCVRKPLSNVELAAEDLGSYGFTPAKTIPAKIKNINKLTSDIIEVTFRVPPTQKISFLEGQYLNTIWRGVKRSYSVASTNDDQELQLIIKNYEGGVMSAYWFQQAKENDLIRLEIPLGTFFLRNHVDLDNIVFIATGTGIAPIKAMLNSLDNQIKLKQFKRIVVLWGMRYSKDIFWKPDGERVEFIPVLSRENESKRYVQHVLSELSLDFQKTAVYACGGDQMIQEAKSIALEKGLQEHNFYSDAFVASN